MFNRKRKEAANQFSIKDFLINSSVSLYYITIIKIIAYGYSNFSHFRNRIMYMINSEYVIKMVDTSKIARKPRKKKI